jgi:hypothetical protein
VVDRHILIQRSLTSAMHFWWAVVTAVTVGIGDLYHVTKEGKIIGAKSTWSRKSNRERNLIELTREGITDIHWVSIR